MIIKFNLKDLITTGELEMDRPVRISDNFKSSTFADIRYNSYMAFCLNKLKNNVNILKLLNTLKNFSNKNCNYKIQQIINNFERNVEKLPPIVFKEYIGKDINSVGENEIFDVGIILTKVSFYHIKGVKELIKQTVIDLIEVLNTPIKNPKKNYYDKNLDLLFDALQLSDKQKKFELLKLDCNMLIINEIFSITHEYCGYNDTITDFFFTKKEYLKLNNESKQIFNADNRYELFQILISSESKTQKDLMNHICSVIKDTKLNFNDFYFIKQKEIILNVLKNAVEQHKKGINILLYGKPGTGKTEFAKTLIKELGVIGYNINVKKDINRSLDFNQSINGKQGLRKYDSSIDFEDDSNSRKTKLLLTNEIANGSNSIILFDEAEDFFRNNYFEMSAQSKYVVNDILENNNVPIIWTTNNLNCMEESYLRRFNYVLELSEMPSKHLEKMIEDLASKYKINVGQQSKNIILTRRPNIGIIDKVFQTYKLSGSNKQEELVILLTDMINNTSFNPNAKKVKINKSDFLPELLNTSEDLIQLADTIVKSGKLDFSILSYGCSGSSKTSFARYLAEKLGIEVIYKNYSELSSCWVGESEKAIQKLFDEATTQKAMIILDEADVLLQDRNKSNHSWEVSQTEALLTAMEDHEYPFVMTTNLFDNLDSAAMRRFDFKIKHNYMTEEQVKLALKHFFNIDYKGNTHLNQLTPGDCVSVKKQIRFLPNITEKEILEKLELECKNKKDYTKTIGF